jgi:hypothetical protein
LRAQEGRKNRDRLLLMLSSNRYKRRLGFD